MGTPSAVCLSRNLALTASSFNKISRRKTLSWSVHAEAGTPERLKEILGEAKAKNVTPRARARSMPTAREERRQSATRDRASLYPPQPCRDRSLNATKAITAKSCPRWAISRTRRWARQCGRARCAAENKERKKKERKQETCRNYSRRKKAEKLAAYVAILSDKPTKSSNCTRPAIASVTENIVKFPDLYLAAQLKDNLARDSARPASPAAARPPPMPGCPSKRPDPSSTLTGRTPPAKRPA
jgi:hypothetical protein